MVLQPPHVRASFSRHDPLPPHVACVPPLSWQSEISGDETHTDAKYEENWVRFSIFQFNDMDCKFAYGILGTAFLRSNFHMIQFAALVLQDK